MIVTMLSDPAQVRIAGVIPACACLLTAVCLLSPHGDCAAGEPRIPAVAVEYLGPSDKPILPVVIACAKPSRAALVTLLSSRSDPEFVELILLPEAEVGRLADAVRLCLDRFGSAVSNTALAVARVTIVPGAGRDARAGGGAEKVSRALNRAEADKVLHALEQFQPADATAAEELKEALKNFRNRTKPQ
jgi:hypothetical protein